MPTSEKGSPGAKLRYSGIEHAEFDPELTYHDDGTISQRQSDGNQIVRDRKGRFVKGGAPKPHPLEARLRQQAKDYLTAIEVGAPPDLCQEILQMTGRVVLHQLKTKPGRPSVEAALEYLKFVNGYQIGLPKRTVDLQKTDMNELYAMLFSEPETDTIDGQRSADGQLAGQLPAARTEDADAGHALLGQPWQGQDGPATD